ncbi:MAG: Holliday junction resolvase RuvX [Aquiluna sp.]|nr:Holliday junction resolvase RuvX [Aquiluna sp.]
MSRRLAIDVGSTRIGVAVSEGTLALPLESISAADNAVTRVIEIVTEKQVTTIYVGLPLNLKGDFTASTQSAIDFARQLAGQGVTVRMIDERLTTKSAQQMLHSSGKKVKESREYIDAQAAALILDFALNSERGSLAGVALEDITDR